MKKLLIPLLALIGMNSYANNDNRVLFSEIQGNIYFNGQPASGATVVRTYNWQHGDGEVSDTFITDNNGYFRFDAAYKGLWPLYIMTEPRVMQKIIVNYNQKDYEIWLYYKTNEFRNTEVMGIYDRVDTGNGYAYPKIAGIITVKCELTSEVRDLIAEEDRDTFVIPPKGLCELVK